MTDGAKVLVGFIMVVAGIIAFLLWTDDRPSDTVRWWRLALTAVTVLCLIAVCIPRRQDLVPDFLFQMANSQVCEKDELCFDFSVSVDNEVCLVHVYFQNQLDSRCIGRIALQPSDSFFGSGVGAVTFEVDCPPAGFGVASVPVPVPAKFQGKEWTFDVGASVDRPDGLGRRVRFRQGAHVSANANHGDGFGTALQVAGALAGVLVSKSRTRVTFQSPGGVLDALPPDSKPEVKILWSPGDELLPEEPI